MMDLLLQVGAALAALAVASIGLGLVLFALGLLFKDYPR